MGTIKRGTPVNRVNPKRKKANFARAYHSRARVEFVKSLKCSACGVVGYSENAHVLGTEGLSRKAGYETIAPLCGPMDGWRDLFWDGEHGPFIGCHKQFDDYRWIFNYRFPDFNAEQVAQDCERAWLEYSK